MTPSLSTKIPQETAKLAFKKVIKALKTTFTSFRLYYSYVFFLYIERMQLNYKLKSYQITA